jgi:hypothetical protein
VETEIGDKKYLWNISKVSELIIKKLRLAILERFVAPNRR